MLLDKIEEVLALDPDVLEKKLPKQHVCTTSFTTRIGEIETINDNGYYFLKTNTAILLNGKPYTTFSKQKLYNNKANGKTEPKTKTSNNTPFTITCIDKEVQISYINTNGYLHLPDFLATYAVSQGIPTISVQPHTVLKFYHDTHHNDNIKLVDVYTHNVVVSPPYYLFKKKFYYTEQADLLSKIIGIFDSFKRGYLKPPMNEKKYKSALIYFLYPYVSLVFYKNTQTTAYPSFITSSINLVIESLHDEIKAILSPLIGLSDEVITTYLDELIMRFNSNPRILNK